jgi:hypothetical protein
MNLPVESSLHPFINSFNTIGAMLKEPDKEITAIRKCPVLPFVLVDYVLES